MQDSSLAIWQLNFELCHAKKYIMSWVVGIHMTRVFVELFEKKELSNLKKYTVIINNLTLKDFVA